MLNKLSLSLFLSHTLSYLKVSIDPGIAFLSAGLIKRFE